MLACLALLGAAAAGHAEAPSFDCGKAESAAETAVCGDAELAQLDRELARLYGLALGGPHLTAVGEKELKATQRGWVKGRDDCWKAEDVGVCVKTEYVVRIGEVRQAYFDARSDDGAGISLGPFVAECPGLDAAMGTVFVNSDPGAVYLAWRDRVAVLDRVLSASGAKYEATLADGHYLFWNKGDGARFEAPGVAGTLECELGEV